MKKYRHAVAAMVLKPSNVSGADGESIVHAILLVHKPRKRDSWQLPQGGVEQGETEEQAALRELEEEAGVRLPEVAHTSARTYCYDFPPEFIRRHNPVNAGQKLCFVVMEAPKDTVVKVDDREVDSYAWVLPEELPKYVDRKEYLSVIQGVLSDYRAAQNAK